MKILIFLFIFFFISNCTNSKSVYWCGDHACINEKEKEEYFKKTMIVEVRNVEKGNTLKVSQIEKLILETDQNVKKRKLNKKGLSKQTKLKEKKIIKEEKELVKQAKIEQKRRIKEEKELAKQAEIEQKRKIKKEKELAKQAKLEEKRRIKEEKKLAQKIKKDENKQIKKLSKKMIKEGKNLTKKNLEIGTAAGNVKINLNKFSELVERITSKNSLRPYPDINDIPN